MKPKKGTPSGKGPMKPKPSAYPSGKPNFTGKQTATPRGK